MLDQVTLTPPLLAKIGTTIVGAASVIAAVDVRLDVAAILGASTLGLTAIARGVAALWKRSVGQAVELTALHAEVQMLRSEAKEHAEVMDRQERTIAQLGATIEVLRHELARQHGDGR